MKTSNPALSSKTFEGLRTINQDEKMTIIGTVHKSLFLVALVLLSAWWSWQNAFDFSFGDRPVLNIPGWYFPVIIAGFVVSLVIIFKKTTAPFLSPVYALAEGMLLGTISAMYEYRFPGLVLQAAFLTMGTLIALLMAYRSGLIRATENFKLGVAAATGGIMIVYLIDMVLRFFGHGVPFIHETGLIGIGVSFVIVVIAALNLVLDFDFIESGAKQGAPRYMEWYAAFGLLVTLVWLYLEMLRLLSKARSR